MTASHALRAEQKAMPVIGFLSSEGVRRACSAFGCVTPGAERNRLRRGTKRRATHFLTRPLDKVRTEMSAFRNPRPATQSGAAAIRLRLHPRCRHAMPRCFEEEPADRLLGVEWKARC